MKHFIIGTNDLYFHLLRDLPYFQPTTNYYGVVVKSWDSQLEKTFLVRDISASPDSYQQFSVTGTTGTDDLEAGVVKMMPFGVWYLEVRPATGSTLNDITSEVLYRDMIRSKEE